MRKKLKIIIPVILLISVISFLIVQHSPKSFNGLLKNNASNITSIHMTNGSTGSGSSVNINGSYYNVSKEINTELLTKWFNSLPSKNN